MKFAVGSRRAVKLEAVEAAIGSYYGGISAEILSCDVKSDIADQPLTLSVTSIGALNRAMRSLRNTPGADMGVGLEAGIERVGDRIVDFGVVQVIGRNGVRGLGITEGIALPEEVAVLVENGATELSDAVARVYDIDSDKKLGT